ncbi:hypothetical protein LZ32DRAFT_612259 [Colletotrichum eremochloae]|nr:hypothetical protein LZ32DRAFT_612259 [Colletotrichum eremochloae]
MIDRITLQEPLITENAPRRRLKEVWATNIWITTSGVWSVDPLATILRNTPVDRILYSVDWPFATYESGKSFMEDLKRSGMVTPEEWEMIGWKNAAKLLKIQLPNKTDRSL